MRTTLFLTTLFAVTLSAGAALAEGPQGGTAKAPRAIDRLRSHGDMVDKTYRAGDKAAPASQATQPGAQSKAHADKTSARINCSSDSGVDCSAARGSDKANGMEASSAQVNRAARAPAFLDKILGSDRTNFNEAGEDQGMSSRAAKRAWSSHAGNNGGGSTAKIPLAQQQQVVRTQEQASSDRMVCNDADECMMSSKAAKKVWAYDGIKKGTWKGPEAAQPLPADVALEAMRKAEQTKHN
jgi:hypothetical protein